MTSRTLAVILGGGAGTRLYPLTANRSKPAVPIGGKYRLIDIPISNCLSSGVKRMFVLTQFNSASLNKHIKKAFHFDIFTKGFVDILAAEQTFDNRDWFQGTADAVRQSFPRFQYHDFDYFLILSGDQLYQMDFNEILESHKKSGAQVTVATIPVNAKDATGFGIMKVNEGNSIVDFVEKPASEELPNWKSPVGKKYAAEEKDYLASMGIYVFNRSAMRQLFEENPESTDFGKEIIPTAVNDDRFKINSYSFGGYWTDIGSIDSFFDANLHLTEFLPQFSLYDNVRPVYTSARMLSPSKIFGTRLTHTLLSDGCIIHAEEISHSVVGIRSRIGPRTTIRHAILFGNDYYQTLTDVSEASQSKLLGIGKDCWIERSIIDKGVKIGNFVTIVGDNSLEDVETDLYCIKEGIVIVKKNVSIPDNTVIGLPKNKL
ncbi:glucose-1-phosphate adenylyltransferase [Chitinophagales bacterium]|nr:glucose-1-phosphate adenylyltransferase [Chitinophagales bacterium]